MADFKSSRVYGPFAWLTWSVVYEFFGRRFISNASINSLSTTARCSKRLQSDQATRAEQPWPARQRPIQPLEPGQPSCRIQRRPAESPGKQIAETGESLRVNQRPARRPTASFT